MVSFAFSSSRSARLSAALALAATCNARDSLVVEDARRAEMRTHGIRPSPRRLFPSGPLELARTHELIERHLVGDNLDILDVGGGPGIYAPWLSELGHHVHLIDPIPLHVAQARAAGIAAMEGDARALARAGQSADVVLLLGPLYHLVDLWIG